MSEELKKAAGQLEKRNYYIENQFDGFFSTIPGEYELTNAEGEVLIDHLSEAQVLQISKIL